MAIKSIKGIKVGDLLLKNSGGFEYEFTLGKTYKVVRIPIKDKDTIKLIGNSGMENFASVGDRLRHFIKVPKNCNMKVFKALYDYSKE